MAGYEDTYQMIISALVGRPAGTEIQPEQHQAFALNMLEYIRSLELAGNAPFVGIAEEDTVPVQPTNERCCYIASVSSNKTVTFKNFITGGGNPITITAGDMEAYIVIMLWNTQWWSYRAIPTNVISQSDQATFYYNLSIRNTYPSISEMEADVDMPLGWDNKKIKVGELVSVVNPDNTEENGIYSYTGDSWVFQAKMEVASADTNVIQYIASGKIDVTNGWDVLDTYNSFDKCGIYVLMANGIPAYHLIVNSDNMMHVINQWIIGNLIIQDGVVGSHMDSIHSIVARTYNFYASSLPVERGEWTPWHYVVGDPDANKPKYPSVVEWSGVTVEDVDVTTVSIQAAGVVVYDTVKKTFLLRSLGSFANYAYSNNWAGREDFQANVWKASNFVAGFYENTYYKGANGDMWIATSSSELMKLYSASSSGQTIEVDDELSVTSENPVQNKVITDTIKDITSWNEADE